MMELQDAVGRILAAIPAPEPLTVALAHAYGRIVLEPLRSPTDLPSFDNSAMDGYAVRSADLRAASTEQPAMLEIIARIAAGQVFTGKILPGTCIRIFTGSPMPQGADCVVMQEDARVAPNQPGCMGFFEPVVPGENVRRRGEDLGAGTSLAVAGQVLSAGRLSLLAAAGLNQVTIGRGPKVALIATGSELREPGQPLEPGQIYESNRVGLAALLKQVAAEPVVFPLVSDTLGAIEQALAKAFEQCDLVVSTGGVSVGELDLVKPAFEKLGGRIEFWKVAIKPGRPFVFGQLGKRLLFGLPGNPVSALVSFLLMVRPALLRWQGAKAVELPTSVGVLAEPLSNPGSRRHFVRVVMSDQGKVSLAGLQGSHMLGSLASANGMVNVAAETTLPAGSAVTVMRWDIA